TSPQRLAKARSAATTASSGGGRVSAASAPPATAPATTTTGGMARGRMRPAQPQRPLAAAVTGPPPPPPPARRTAPRPPPRRARADGRRYDLGDARVEGRGAAGDGERQPAHRLAADEMLVDGVAEHDLGAAVDDGHAALVPQGEEILLAPAVAAAAQRGQGMESRGQRALGPRERRPH